MEDHRFYLPATQEHSKGQWIRTTTWHRVKTNIGTLNGLPNTFGRVIERRDYMLFEDERDATMIRLLIK